MSEIDNIKVLAATAHESGAYEDSYKYNSKILEIEITNAHAWIQKGIAAAFLTDTTGSKISEASVLIRKGLELGVDDASKNKIITSIREAYNQYVNNLNDELLGKVKDFQKVSMPAGGSAILHGLAQNVNKLQTAKSQAAARVKGLELLKLMCEVKPEKYIYSLVNTALGNAQEHSKQNGKYINENPQLQAKYDEYVKFVSTELKSRFPDEKVPTPSQTVSSGKKEGCFIATAATGNYDHPKVMILRSFRDQSLMTTKKGRLFVNCYYSISPHIAKFISRSTILKKIVMIVIVNPLVAFVKCK